MQDFSARVLAWFDVHGRKHLPWQQNPEPYSIWVSEIMLQQTQVTTVIPYFQRFIARFPDVTTLANADTDTVLAHWAGLGYYSRARHLHKAAQIIQQQHDGVFPQQIDEVMALPGIGKSTAGAILSLALKQRHAILDGNVKRVLSRHGLIDGIPNQSATLKKQWAIAESLTPNKDCDKYTQAMMDLGAMVCTRSQPDCGACPVYVDCGARLHDCIADYPNKKPKKTLPEKDTVMLIITDGNKVYLQKRPDTGIWGGLWSFPEISTDEQSHLQAFLETQHLSVKHYQTLADYTHTFTHYRLYITPILVEVDKLDTGFTPKQYTQMGLPTPIKRLLDTYCEITA